MGYITPLGLNGEENVEPEQKDNYRLLFENSPEAILIFKVERDAGGNIQDWVFKDVNAAMMALINLPRDQVVELHASQVYEPQTFEFYRNLISEAVTSGKPQKIERNIPNTDRLFLSTVMPLQGEYLAASGVEVTAQRQAEAALQESQQRLMFSSKAAEYGQWTFSPDNQQILIDAEGQRLLGLQLPEDLMNYEAFEQHVHPQDKDRVFQCVQKAIEELSELDIEYRIVWPDGSVHWIHSIGRAFEGKDNLSANMAGVVIDISRRKFAELEREKVAEMHRRQNELLERLVREAPFGIALHEGSEHRYLLVNAAYRDIARVKNDLTGCTLMEAWPEVEHTIKPILDRVYETQIEAHGTDVPFTVERASGQEVIYLTFTVTPHFNLQGEVEGVISLMDETTEDVMARSQVEFEQSRLEALFQSAPVGIVLADAEGKVQRANPIAEEILNQRVAIGHDLQQQTRMKIYSENGQLLEPDQLPLTRSALHGETVTNKNIRVFRADGSDVLVLVSAAPVVNSHGNVVGAVGVFQDITQQKKAENERMKTAAQLEVHRHLTRSREMERLQIAQTLHEGLLQELIGMQFAIEEALEEGDKERRLNQMHLIQKTLARNIRELRDYCYDLRPPSLSPFGLEKAIRSHSETFGEKYPNLTIHLDLLPDGQFLPEPIRLVLFRIYQEVMLNITKHANATDIYIRFVFNNRRATLEVRDNGVGFTIPTDWVESARQGRLGLVGAQERVESVGGMLTLSSRSGEGTVVLVTIPLDKASRKGMG